MAITLTNLGDLVPTRIMDDQMTNRAHRRSVERVKLGDAQGLDGSGRRDAKSLLAAGSGVNVAVAAKCVHAAVGLSVLRSARTKTSNWSLALTPAPRPDDR